jgi:DNA-binding beta-propeller fold protein YncE
MYIKLILVISIVILYLTISAFTFNKQISDANSVANVSLFNANEYTFVTKWGKEGEYEGEFDTTRNTGIAVDQESNVYVADLSKHRIQKFDSNGIFLTMWRNRTVSENFGLVFDTELYIPKYLSIDQENNVYVVDAGNSRIQKFDSNGKFITKWGKNGSNECELNGVQEAEGIAIDQENNVYVVDAGNSRIQKFDSNGKFITMLGNKDNNIQFNLPINIVIDQKDNVYVSDLENLDGKRHRIQKFDSNGNFITQWMEEASYFGLAIDQADNLYITNYSKHYIKKTDSSGNFITQWGSEGTGDGQFKRPTGITVDQYGNVYVIDGGNYRIQKFAPKI